MTKKNGTKRSLLMSAVALVLCFSMLIGSTFAWFTDSVTSSNNIIKSGTLDVEMSWADGKADPAATATVWKDASEGAIFNNDLWEPGYVDAKHIQIKNVGTLAFKYKLNIVANGEVSKLADVIDVYYLSTAAQVTRDMIAAATPISTLAKLITDPDGAAYGTLLAEAGKDTTTVTIALKMRESAGNEYQELSIGSDFSVQLLAAQLEAEEDVFDKTYDKFADYDGEISNATTLAAALAKDGTYKVVSDITVDETMTVPAGVTVNLDLNGKEIKGTVGRDADGNRVHTLVNNGTLNLVGGTVTSAGVNGGSAIYNADGATLTVENVILNGAPQEGSTWPSYTVNNYGTLTVSDSSIYGVQGIIATNNTANTTVNNVIAYRDGWSSGHVFYNSSTAKVTINGGTYTNDGNGVDGTMIYGGETVVNGGTFIVKEGAYFALCSGSKLTVNGGDFSNIKSCIAWGGTMEISGGTFGFNPTTYVADGYVAKNNGNGTWTVEQNVTTGADLKAQIKDSTTTYITAGEDIDLSNTEYSDNASTYSFTISDGKTLDLNDNTFIRPGKGSGSGLIIPANAAVTVKNGTISNADGDMTAVDMAVGSNATFEDVDFVGNGDDMIRLRADTTGKSTIIFEDCTFTNAGIILKGMNGACEIDVQFIRCTFNGSYKMYDAEGNALTDPYGHVHYTNCLVDAASNYLYGSLSFDGCTFDYDASEYRYANSNGMIELGGTSNSYNEKITLTLKDVTLNCKNALPVKFTSSAYKQNVIVVEEGTNTYTNNGGAVNYDGSAK